MLSEKYSAECLAEGFEYIGRGSRKDYSAVKCNVCGTVDEFQRGNIRAGRVRCKTCHETKMKQECLEHGFEWIRKVDGNNSLCRCLKCGHEDTFEQGAMRRGKVKCYQCHDTKMKEECTAQGFEWIRKVDWNNSLCRCLKCGHEDTYQQVHMRNGKVACSNCSPGHWNEQCFFYLARITYQDTTIIKIGVAADPHKRYTQYGLIPGADITEILRLRFDTKLEAVEFESKMKSLLQPLRIPPDLAKLVLTYQGFTECYSSDAEEILKDSFV